MLSASEPAASTIKLATFNASLYREHRGELLAELTSRACDQAKKIAAVIQTVRPDVLLLNEIDGNDDLATVRSLRDNYFAVGQFGLEPLDYSYFYQPTVNTGVASGIDLNRNDSASDPEDNCSHSDCSSNASRFSQPSDAADI